MEIQANKNRECSQVIERSTFFFILSLGILVVAVCIEELLTQARVEAFILVAIALTIWALYSSVKKDSDEGPSVAYASGIITLLIGLFLGGSWGFAQGIAFLPNADALQACVILSVLGGISAFTGGILAKREWEGKSKNFLNGK